MLNRKTYKDMAPPDPASPASKGATPSKAKQQAPQPQPLPAAFNEDADKLNQINYSVQNYIKELEISEGQLSSVLK